MSILPAEVGGSDFMDIEPLCSRAGSVTGGGRGFWGRGSGRHSFPGSVGDSGRPGDGFRFSCKGLNDAGSSV